MSQFHDTPTLAAAHWLASQLTPPAHVVPTLKERFGLTGPQACQAIALARGEPTPTERKEGKA